MEFTKHSDTTSKWQTHDTVDLIFQFNSQKFYECRCYYNETSKTFQRLKRFTVSKYDPMCRYLLYRLQGLSVFLLCLLDLWQTAAPDVSLLLVKCLHTHKHTHTHLLPQRCGLVIPQTRRLPHNPLIFTSMTQCTQLTDRRRDGFGLHQVLVDLAAVFIVIHAVVQVLLILHPVLTAAHGTHDNVSQEQNSVKVAQEHTHIKSLKVLKKLIQQ